MKNTPGAAYNRSDHSINWCNSNTMDCFSSNRSQTNQTNNSQLRPQKLLRSLTRSFGWIPIGPVFGERIRIRVLERYINVRFPWPHFQL